MNIKIAGNAVVITSKVKKTDYEKLRNFNKEALVTKVKDVPTFGLGYTERKDGGSIGPAGMTFDALSAEGELQLTVMIADMPAAADDKKAAVAKLFGNTLSELGKLEDQIGTALAGVDTLIAGIEANTVVL